MIFINILTIWPFLWFT